MKPAGKHVYNRCCIIIHTSKFVCMPEKIVLNESWLKLETVEQ